MFKAADGFAAPFVMIGRPDTAKLRSKETEHARVHHNIVTHGKIYNGGEALMVKHRAFNSKNWDRYPAPLPIYAGLV